MTSGLSILSGNGPVTIATAQVPTPQGGTVTVLKHVMVDANNNVIVPVADATIQALEAAILAFAQNVVDRVTNQTVGGNKTFTGAIALQGSTSVPTLAAGDNSQGAASTAFVSTAVAAASAASTAFLKGSFGWVNANWYRQTGDPDDTAAIKRAVATGQPVYLPWILRPYVVSSDIVISTVGQVIFGDGRQKTSVQATSNAGFSQGVFVMAAPFAEMRDIGITTVQPDTATYSSIIQYVPSVYVAGATRVGLYRCGLYQAWVGVKLAANCGGFIGDDVDVSTFNFGIDIDGCEDTVRLNNWHGYPFNTTANQNTILEGTQAPMTWLHVGRCDDLKVTNSLFLGGLTASFFASAPSAANGNTGGAVTASFTNVALDSVSRAFVMSAGTCDFKGGYISMAAPAAVAQAVSLGGGANLSLAPGWMYLVSSDLAGAPSVPWIANNGGNLSIVGCGDICLALGGANGAGASEDKSFYVQSAGTSTISSNTFYRAVSTKLTNAFMTINALAGNRATMLGNRINDQGSISNVFIDVAGDEWHRFIGNCAPGWTNSFPTGSGLNGVYAYN